MLELYFYMNKQPHKSKTNKIMFELLNQVVPMTFPCVVVIGKYTYINFPSNIRTISFFKNTAIPIHMIKVARRKGEVYVFYEFLVCVYNQFNNQDTNDIILVELDEFLTTPQYMYGIKKLFIRFVPASEEKIYLVAITIIC